MMCESSSLSDKGIRQGTLIHCKNFSEGFKDEVASCRAIVDRRGNKVSAEQLLLILSQDCDIANKNVKNIEVLAVKKKGIPTGSADLDRTRPRDYRKLFLPFEDKYIECKSDYISIIPKSSLSLEELCPNQILDSKSLRILLDWRIGSYKRTPFPDNFNRAFLHYLRDDGRGLGAFLEQNYKNIIDLFMFVSPEADESADKYDVSVTAILSDECTEKSSEEIRRVLSDHWRELSSQSSTLNFGQVTGFWVYEAPDVMIDIVASPEDITLADILQLKRFNMDFLCYPDFETVVE